MIKRQSIAIISIIVIGTLFGVGYSASTIISDSGITTPTITVSGACNGCGAIEGTYTTWSNTLNETVAGSSGSAVSAISTSIDGSVVFQNTNSNNFLVALNGTVVTALSVPSGSVPFTMISHSQSISGTYKTFLTSSGINVYKNNSLLTTIGIKTSDFFIGDLRTVSISISPDGKYMSIAGKDTGGALDRVVILTGS